MHHMASGYFIRLEGATDVVGTPANIGGEAIGSIGWFDPITQLARVDFLKPVWYRSLLESGIPLEHIKFKGD